GASGSMATSEERHAGRPGSSRYRFLADSSSSTAKISPSSRSEANLRPEKRATRDEGSLVDGSELVEDELVPAQRRDGHEVEEHREGRHHRQGGAGAERRGDPERVGRARVVHADALAVHRAELDPGACRELEPRPERGDAPAQSTGREADVAAVGRK